ncbi:MAG: hypothetical protein HUK20_02080 [Fibrobacter sp.]|nr:hypothetical protein [Fibrobacter sp.]
MPVNFRNASIGNNNLNTKGPLDSLSLSKSIRDLLTAHPDSERSYRLSNKEQAELLDFYLDFLRQNNSPDTTWVRQLKDSTAAKPDGNALSINLQNVDFDKDSISRPRAAFTPFDKGNQVRPEINFNMGRLKKDGERRNLNSKEGIAEMFHELFHAYQYLAQQESWPANDSTGRERRTQLDVAAYEIQLMLESLLGLKADKGWQLYFSIADQKAPSPDNNYKKKI